MESFKSEAIGSLIDYSCFSFKERSCPGVLFDNFFTGFWNRSLYGRLFQHSCWNRRPY